MPKLLISNLISIIIITYILQKFWQLPVASSFASMSTLHNILKSFPEVEILFIRQIGKYFFKT